MKNMTVKIIFASLLGIMPLVAHAELGSSFRVELGTDNDDGDERYLDLVLDLGTGSRVLISQGTSTTASSSGEIENSYWSMGMSTDPTTDLGIGIYYSHWGNSDAMEIDTLGLDVTVNTKDWGFIISPQTRDIKLDRLNQRDATFSSQGLGLTADYYGIDNVYLSAGYLTNTYPGNLSTLADNPIFRMRNYSAATLDQSLGLEDHRITYGAGYSFDQATVGIQRSDSTSAIDDVVTTTDKIYLSWNFHRQWNLYLSTGKSSSEGGLEDTNFNNVALTYRW